MNVHHLFLEPLREGVAALTEFHKGGGRIVALKRYDDHVALRRVLLEGTFPHLQSPSAGGELSLPRPGQLGDETAERVHLARDDRDRNRKDSHDFLPETQRIIRALRNHTPRTIELHFVGS